MALTLVSIPQNAEASVYAYVDTVGNVRSVVADDWRLAINTAPSIHLHSGVMILYSVADFKMVGNSITAY